MNCDPVYLWAFAAQSYPSFAADPSHQCFNRPNGQRVPRLAVWTVGAIGGDALNGRATENVHVWRCSTPNTPVRKHLWDPKTESVSTIGSSRANSQTWHPLAVLTVEALVAGISCKTGV